MRIEFPGAIYHVTSRLIGSWAGIRERLFRDDRDSQRFFKRLGEGVDTFGIRLYLRHFCGLPNDGDAREWPRDK